MKSCKRRDDKRDESPSSEAGWTRTPVAWNKAPNRNARLRDRGSAERAILCCPDCRVAGHAATEFAVIACVACAIRPVVIWLDPLSGPIRDGPPSSELGTAKPARAMIELTIDKRCLIATQSQASVNCTMFAVEAIKMLYKNHLVSAKRIPLTACPSWRLLEGLIR